MNDLRTAAQQALEACEQRLPLRGQAAIIDELNNLRAALAQQAYTDDLNQRIKLYVGSRCAPPQQAEPVEPVEPERDDLPSTVFVVLNEIGIPVFCAAYPQACNDHIGAAIVEHNIHSAGLWVVREYTLDTRTRSQKLADAGYARRPSLRARDMRKALELIAAPQRPDGTWNRDREACRQIAAEALGRYDDE